MDRIDILLKKAKPRSIFDLLKEDNPYLELNYSEIKEYMKSGTGKEHPESGTLEHTKYMYALLQARRDRKVCEKNE